MILNNYVKVQIYVAAKILNKGAVNSVDTRKACCVLEKKIVNDYTVMQYQT